VPLPVDVVVVPSVQVVVAPAAGAAGAFDAAGVLVAGAAAPAAAGADFCTPPWPLQVPLPVEVVVVPSLQVVGAGSAARLGIASANTSIGAAIRAATVIFFMEIHSPVYFGSERRIVNRFSTNAIGRQGFGPMGKTLMTSMTNRV
jgi:hypothetical protein